MRRKESILKGIIIGGAVYLASAAFAQDVRREMFRRDGGVCQCYNCFVYNLQNVQASWLDGWHMQAAHYPELHNGHVDRNINNGRMLCTTDHIVEEIMRENHKGAELLWRSQTIRRIGTYSQDWKMPLNWYYDYAESDQEGRQGLIDAYRERFLYTEHQAQPSLFSFR